MLFDAAHSNYSKLMVVDEMGREVSAVVSYDNVSGEARFLLRNREGKYIVDGGELVVASVVLKNAKVIVRDEAA